MAQVMKFKTRKEYHTDSAVITTEHPVNIYGTKAFPATAWIEYRDRVSTIDRDRAAYLLRAWRSRRL